MLRCEQHGHVIRLVREVDDVSSRMLWVPWVAIVERGGVLLTV